MARVQSIELRDFQEVDPQEVSSGMQSLDKPSVCRSADTSTSQLAWAKLVIAENRITRDLKLGAFVVRNSEGEHDFVTFISQAVLCLFINK